MVGYHKEPSVYYIQLLNKEWKGHPKVVNRHQIYDLNQSSPPSESLVKDDGFLVVPSILSQNSKSNIISDSNSPFTHQYNTRSTLKAATAGRQVVVKTQVTQL